MLGKPDRDPLQLRNDLEQRRDRRLGSEPSQHVPAGLELRRDHVAVNGRRWVRQRNASIGGKSRADREDGESVDKTGHQERDLKAPGRAPRDVRGTPVAPSIRANSRQQLRCHG